MFTRTHQVVFGDCDPAGIVYYPNFYRWFDGTFHAWLQTFGGHGAICARLGSAGTGLMTARAEFNSPARDGDLLTIALAIDAWHNRAFDLTYRVTAEDRHVATGYETRGVFMDRGDGRLTAGDVRPLRDVIETGHDI